MSDNAKGQGTIAGDVVPYGEAADVLISPEHKTQRTGGAQDGDTDGVPYDRGWAWMVVVGNFVNYVLISGYVKSGGVFFVELLRHFQAPASRTALLFAIRGGVFSISGLFVMNAVVGRLGCRKTVLTGAVLMSLSAILSSLAKELTLLICLQAVLLGVADAMLTSPGEVLTAAYFRKRRSLAIAVVKAGASIGSVSYPPMLTYLVSEYGLRGALLLTGAVSLHSLPAALLLRPTSYFRKCAKRGTGSATKRETEDDATLDVRSVEAKSDHSRRGSLERFREETGFNSEASTDTAHCKIREDCSSEMEFKSVTEMHVMSPSVVHVTGSDLEGSECDEVLRSSERQPLKNVAPDDANIWKQRNPKRDTENPIASSTEQADGHSRALSRDRHPIQWLKSKLLILDFSLFRRPSFCLFFIYFMFSPTVNVGVDYLPALADQQDVPKLQAAKLLSIVGGVDMVSRLSSGFLADLEVVPVPAMVASALVVLGVAYQFVRFLTSFALLLILALLQGLLAGVVNAMIPVLILHAVGLRDMAKGIGFQFLAEGAFLAAFHPLLGSIRDSSGSYVLVYHVIGCVLLAAAALLLLQELLRRRESRQTEHHIE